MVDEIRWGEEAVRMVSTLLAAGFGAWLSIRFFPLKAKHDEWRWKKRIGAQEFIFDILSEIAFVSKNHLNSEFGDSFSMAGLAVAETENIIFDRIRKLHKRGAGLSLSLNGEQNKILSQFLISTQEALDAARESWSEIDQNDDREIEVHTHQTIEQLGRIAAETLNEIRPLIKKEYQ